MTATPPPINSILFVCLGNICRSPLAEGVLRHLARERGLDEELQIDSAGTGSWHIGEPPDRRSAGVARAHGIELDSRARQVSPEDAERFDLILAMDRANLRDLKRIFAGGVDLSAELRLFRDFDPEIAEGTPADVPDPYYGGPDGFEKVHAMVVRCCEVILDAVEDRAE